MYLHNIYGTHSQTGFVLVSSVRGTTDTSFELEKAWGLFLNLISL